LSTAVTGTGRGDGRGTERRNMPGKIDEGKAATYLYIPNAIMIFVTI